MLFGVALTAVGAIILGAPALVAGVIAAIVAAVATMAVVIHEHWEEIKQWFSDMWAGIQEIAGTIAQWFSSNVIEPVKQFFTQLWETVKQLASDAWTGIQGIWSVVSGWFNSTIIQPVAGFFKGMWDGIKQSASSVWEAVKGIWSAAGEWFSQHVTQPLASAFDAAGNAVKNTINGLVVNVEGMLNAVIRGVNWLISQLNKVSFDVPGWVPGIGGRSFGFSLQKLSEVSLPRLAQGAVIPPNREFMAVLGDQSHGQNLEAPEALIRKIVREEAGGVNAEALSILQAILEAVRKGHVIMVDRRVLGQTVTQEQNRMTRQAGRAILLT